MMAPIASGAMTSSVSTSSSGAPCTNRLRKVGKRSSRSAICLRPRPRNSSSPLLSRTVRFCGTISTSETILRCAQECQLQIFVAPLVEVHVVRVLLLVDDLQAFRPDPEPRRVVRQHGNVRHEFK